MCLLTLEDAVKNRFLYDGNRINDDDTPATLDMEDGGMWFSIYYVFPI
jgi:Ubiquitin-2 like Rad60 SUMO-like